MSRSLAWIRVALPLLACSPATGELRALLEEEGSGPGATATLADAELDAAPDAAADAAVDAPPEAGPPPPIDLAVAWTRHVITPGAATGSYRGADGVAIDPGDAGGPPCWLTAWEEGGIVTRACPGASGWTTELVASGLIGVEDARGADLDRDGTVDVVAARDTTTTGGVYVHFRGAANVTATLTHSLRHGRVMQLAIADVDADGWPDIVFGTRLGTPSVVAWLRNPGGNDAHVGLLWSYEAISVAGWVMSLVPATIGGELAIVVSDRASYKDAANVTRWDLYGARWIARVAGAWASHPIGWQAGTCDPYTSPSCARTPADEMFLAIVDVDGDGLPDVIDGQSTDGRPDSRIVVHRNLGDWSRWSHTVLPPAANVGHYVHVAAYDVDQDDDIDLVVTARKGDQGAMPPIAPVDAGKSCVYWYRNDGAAGWHRGEVSGAEGGKFDNVEQLGRCVITSEQLDPIGGLGVVAYCPPGSVP